MIQPLTSDLAESFGIDSFQGVPVAQVNKHSPAEEAGLQQGDIIERIHGEPVKDVGSFRNRVALTAPGSTVELAILRNGKHQIMNVTIGKLTKDKLVAEETSQHAEDIGLTVQTLTPELAEQLDAGPGEGMIITEVRPDSIAAMAGIKAGTIILQTNRKQVKSAAEFQRAARESVDDKRLLLLIREGNTQRYVALNWWKSRCNCKTRTHA